MNAINSWFNQYPIYVYMCIVYSSIMFYTQRFILNTSLQNNSHRSLLITHRLSSRHSPDTFHQGMGWSCIDGINESRYRYMSVPKELFSWSIYGC